MYYKINNGNIELSGNKILENINFYIKEKEKIGIVGRNGCGKTTLLRAIINNDLFSYSDNFKIEKDNFKIGYIKQNLDINMDTLMIDYIKSAYSNIIELEKNLRKLEVSLSKEYNEKVLNKYNDLTFEYEYLGGYTYKNLIELAIAKFKFNEEDKLKKLSEFSNGQLAKLSFIKLILSKPDLLILDEPTNHIDIDTIEWLEDYLKNYDKSIIIVSHDRMFLDNVCNVIYNIENNTLKRYNGNYTYFKEKYEEDYKKQLKDYNSYEKEVNRLKAIADKFRYKPSKASMAMSKLKQIDRMTKVDKPERENTKTFKVNLTPNKESYREVLKVKNLQIGYNNNIISTLNFNLLRGDKLGIIGKNGSGKTTLIKTLIGQLDKIGGKYTFGERVEIGYFSQQLDNIDENNTIYEEIEKANPKMTSNEIRNLLGAFEFSGDSVFKKINCLSGGEKVRVSLAKILNNKPNLLILDEPSNHLDIISKNTIEKLLKEYKGTIIVVSHDRYLINNVCNKLLVFTQNDTYLYNYGYSEWKNSIKSNTLNKCETKKNDNKKDKVKSNNNELKALEHKILLLENKVKTLNQELLKEEVYLNLEKSTSIQNEINELEIEIDNLTNKWAKITE